MEQVREAVLRTLLYFDIWAYPLTVQEIFLYLPLKCITIDQLSDSLRLFAGQGSIFSRDGYYFVRGRTEGVVTERTRKEKHALRLWRMARLSMQLIRRFPFVRAVSVSGDLSKNATSPESDVDFFIIAEAGRLWIARSLLILFKKTFLLNSRKYFCLNYFAATDNLELDDRNVYLATEIATLKPMYNSVLLRQYMEANAWVRDYLPHFDPAGIDMSGVCEKHSRIQRLGEFLFRLLPADRLDSFLLRTMRNVWARRYPMYDADTRERIFRSTKFESRAYACNFRDTVLSMYADRLTSFGIRP